jgi:hypothetical protein
MGTGFLAVRALQIAKFHNRHCGLRWPSGWPVNAFVELGARIVEGMSAEGQNISRNCVLSVSANQQAILICSL